MNFAPWERNKWEHMHISFIHPGPNEPIDPEGIYEIQTEEALMLYWHGIMVLDASTGEEFLLRAFIAGITDDSRAVPKLLRVTQTPADHGACWLCDIDGFNVAGRATYAGLTCSTQMSACSM